MVAREAHRLDDILRPATADDHQRLPIDHLVPDPPGILVVFRPTADELPFQIRREPLDHALGENHRFNSMHTHGRSYRTSISADAACVSRTGIVDSPQY